MRGLFSLFGLTNKLSTHFSSEPSTYMCFLPVFWLRFVWFLVIPENWWCGSTDPTMMRTESYLRSNLIAADGSRVYLPSVCACPYFVLDLLLWISFHEYNGLKEMKPICRAKGPDKWRSLHWRLVTTKLQFSVPLRFPSVLWWPRTSCYIISYLWSKLLPLSPNKSFPRAVLSLVDLPWVKW